MKVTGLNSKAQFLLAKNRHYSIIKLKILEMEFLLDYTRFIKKGQPAIIAS